MNAILELDSNEIKKIIVLYVEQETGKKVDNNSFDFKISNQCIGYGVNEHYESYFRGCTLKLTD